ncbi:alternative ribosome rescue aminoacyl-tRNA hydrolase ArfB [Candidatus Leptofilum sp.]|uniref:alternative ribosome rescue aminoacyl-tRNA hydrolase ArfB n=1 Tax=Candidatus Leptofilum sp. TaxID=3241576 RepID=UPI003B5C0059
MDAERLIPVNAEVQIPLAELRFRFSNSSGPGGQHVNKSATRVTLLFNVANSPSLPEEVRERLLRRLANRIDKEGVLQLNVQSSRSQHRNRDTAVSLFQQLLADALKKKKKRRRTKPSKAAVEKRLAEKKKRSERKRDRSQKW